MADGFGATYDGSSGLDATPALRAKIAQAGDRRCRNFDIILRDEIGHVAIGNRWYSYPVRGEH